MNICLFDIDGTLLASGGAGKAAMEAALTEEFGVEQVSGQVPYAGRTDRAIVGDLLTVHGFDDAPHQWERLRDAYLRRLPAHLARKQGAVLPGIAALLEHLRERGDVVLGLLTGNTCAGARVKLGHYGLFDYFVCGGYGDEHRCRDDVAREALAAVETHLQTRVTPDHVWVIGDTPLDVRCARAIGARAVAVATGGFSVEQLAAEKPDVVLSDFADAVHVLDDWLDRAAA